MLSIVKCTTHPVTVWFGQMLLGRQTAFDRTSDADWEVIFEQVQAEIAVEQTEPLAHFCLALEEQTAHALH